MSRRLLLSVVVAAMLAAGCSEDGPTGQATGDSTTAEGGQSTVAAGSAGEITLRVARGNDGPWARSLSLEHGPDGQPTSFNVCAAWDETQAREGCAAAPGATLPEGTVLRLEQRPAGAAAEIPESPGWGTVGSSELAELEVPLSDFVAGLDVRNATYRVTLRRLEGGPALAVSNLVTVTWSE